MCTAAVVIAADSGASLGVRFAVGKDNGFTARAGIEDEQGIEGGSYVDLIVAML
jgi:hypothetical protein